MATGCPKSAAKLDLSDEATKKRAVRLMKEEVFADAYAQYQCWADGRMVVPLYAANPAGIYKYTGFSCATLGGGMTAQEAQAKAKEVRNRIFYDGQGIIDEIYFKYATGLRSDRSKLSFLADIADIGLGGAIGLTKGSAQTISDLGTILTGFRAGRDSGRLRFYNNQTTEVILDQMDASRSEVFLNFRTTDSQKPIGEYPVESVFADLFKYFAVGSQTEAFKRIRRKTAASAEVAEAKILRLEKIDPANIFGPTRDMVVKINAIGVIKDRFVREINEVDALAVGDATKVPRTTALNDKFKAIFNELTTGARKADFDPYFNAVRVKAGTHYGATFTAFVTSGTTKAEMEKKLDLLLELKNDVFKDYTPDSPKHDLAASLLEEISRLFVANKY
ncbi:MAG: hypothetical protein ABL952_15485 [Pyrinomonadaceae bacterium]